MWDGTRRWLRLPCWGHLNEENLASSAIFAPFQKCDLGWVLYKSQIFMTGFVVVPTSWGCFEYYMRNADNMLSTVADIQ